MADTLSETHTDPDAARMGSAAAGIIQATALVTAIALVVKGLGLAEKLLLAFFFGTGPEVDAYLVAYSIPFSAYIVLREVVKPAFLPTFLQSRLEAEGRGWRLFAVTGTVLLLLLGAVTAAGVFLTRPLMELAAPGFAGEQRELAIDLLRLAMPALLLLGASSLTTATLHGYKRFALPAVGEASLRAGPILLLLATGSVPGMALGVVLGALGKLGIETWGLRRHLARLRPTLDLAFGPVRTVGRLAVPLLGAFFLSLFVGPLVENAFASRVGVGSVAALAYSRKIAETLTTILPYTLGLVLLPFSAEMTAKQDTQALVRTLGGALRGLILLFLPLTVGLMVLREPFVRLLLERGAFTAASTALTAGPLLYYALALVPFGLEAVVIQFFFARQDTLTPVLADVASFVLNVALIPLLLSAVGLGGIALAAALAKAAKVLVLLVIFGRRVPAFRLANLAPFAAKMLLAALATAAILHLWVQTAGSLSADGGIAIQAAYLGGGALLGGGAFLLAAHLLGVPEPEMAWRRACAWRHTGAIRTADADRRKGERIFTCRHVDWQLRGRHTSADREHSDLERSLPCPGGVCAGSSEERTMMTRKHRLVIGAILALLCLACGSSLGIAYLAQTIPGVARLLRGGPAEPTAVPPGAKEIHGLLATGTLTPTPIPAPTWIPRSPAFTPSASATPARSAAPAIATPHPGWIAFESRRGANHDYEIVAMAPDGSRQTNLTRSWADDVAPTWAPDGRRIAFLSFRDTLAGKWGMGRGSIYAMSFEPGSGTGGGVWRVTDDGGSDDWPSWSPDGMRIAFDSNRSGNWDIWIVNADGTGLMQLTRHPADDRHANWSPDGRTIAFTSSRSGDEDVWILDVEAALAAGDDASATNLTNTPGRDRYPFWSPDGRQLTFNTNRDGNSEIYVMEADGSMPHNVSQSPQSQEGLADWAPDGKRLVFYSDRSGNKEVYILDLASLAWSNISQHPASDEFCVWSP